MPEDSVLAERLLKVGTGTIVLQLYLAWSSTSRNEAAPLLTSQFYILYSKRISLQNPEYNIKEALMSDYGFVYY
jgi:hypothetical protein